MREVSNEYKLAMKQPLRNRGDVIIAIGDTNPEIQSEAKGVEGEEDNAIYFAREFYLENSAIFRGGATEIYGTYEQDFVKADGKMKFPPRTTDNAPYLDTGYVSNGFMTSTEEDTQATFRFYTDTEFVPPVVVTFEFWEGSVPERATANLSSDTSGISVGSLMVINNNKATANYGGLLPDYNGEYYDFTIKARQADNNRRMRVKSITFGTGTVLTSEIIESAEVKSYCSHINEDLPTQDLTVKLINYDSRYDADNPDNPLKVLDNADQQINMYLGYDVDDEGNYEWVHVGSVLSSEWASSKFKATITGVDRMRNDDALFIHEYQELLNDATAGAWIRLIFNKFDKVIPYEYDGDLEDVAMDLSLVRTLPCKEVLQQLANYCRRTMYINGDGRVVITNREDAMLDETTISSDYVGVSGASTETHTYTGTLTDTYDSVKARLRVTAYNNTTGRDDDIITYRDVTVSGTSYSYTFDDTDVLCDGHYGSCYIDIIGYKELTNPEFEMTGDDIIEDISTEKEELIKEVIVPYYTPVVIKIDETQIAEDVISVPSDGIDYGVDFGDTFYADKLVTVINMNNLTSASSFVRGSVNDSGQDTSSTTRLRSPYIDVSDFGAVRLKVNSEVEVYGIAEYASNNAYLGWKQTDSSEATVELRTTTAKIKILVRYPSDGTIQTSALTSAFCGGAWTFDDEYAMNPFDPTDYYTQYFDQTWGTELKIIITAKSYINFTSTPVSYQVNDSGKSLTWDNPLVGTKENALAIAAWIGEYLRSNILYNYQYRGNPEIESNDVILQENDFIPNMKVVIAENTIRFDGAFKGELKTRRRVE